MNYEEIVAENEASVPIPDLFILLDVEPENGIDRIRRRSDEPNDFEDCDSLRKAREIFLKLHERAPKRRSVRIDAAQDIRAVCGAALDHFKIAAANKISESLQTSPEDALNATLAIFDEEPIARK